MALLSLVVMSCQMHLGEKFAQCPPLENTTRHIGIATSALRLIVLLIGKGTLRCLFHSNLSSFATYCSSVSQVCPMAILKATFSAFPTKISMWKSISRNGKRIKVGFINMKGVSLSVQLCTRCCITIEKSSHCAGKSSFKQVTATFVRRF